MRTWKRWAVAAGVVVVFWLYGAIHVIYGKGLGVTTCWKVGWTYSDTFVDFTRLQTPARFEGKVLAAVDKCQIVPDEKAWDRDLVIICLAIAGLVIGTIVLWSRYANRYADRHGVPRE